MFKDLVLANRSYRGFDRTRPVSREELLSFIDLARQTPSGGNLQPLRYRLVTDVRETAAVQALSRWGAALPELHLPFPGTEAPAGANENCLYNFAKIHCIFGYNALF